MKKLMILMAILTMAVVAKAQHEEGDFMVQPKVGLNIATLSDADKAITDLHFGIETEYMVTDNFSLGLGAILSNQGAHPCQLLSAARTGREGRCAAWLQDAGQGKVRRQDH